MKDIERGLFYPQFNGNIDSIKCIEICRIYTPVHRATNTVLIKTEHLVYPFTSFLAEIGGALGLFLGISFLQLWEVFQIVATFGASSKKLTQNLH